MPFLRIETNVRKDKIPNDFVQKTCAVISKALEKDIKYCVATIVPDVTMSMGGTNEPCASATLMSISGLSKEKNKAVSAVIGEHVNKTIGVPADRMYITFNQVEPSFLGYNNSTFHYILGGK